MKSLLGQSFVKTDDTFLHWQLWSDETCIIRQFPDVTGLLRTQVTVRHFHTTHHQQSGSLKRQSSSLRICLQDHNAAHPELAHPHHRREAHPVSPDDASAQCCSPTPRLFGVPGALGRATGGSLPHHCPRGARD